MSFKLTWKSHIICLGISFFIILLIYPTAEGVLSEIFMQGFIFYPTNYLIVNFYICIVALMIPITLVHELIHGAAYTIFGGKVKFGFKFIFAYTQEITEIPIKRNKFLIVLLAPLTLISLFSLLMPSWLCGIVFLLNLLGSSGDIYMSLYLCRCRYSSSVIDKIYGFDII